MEFRILGPLEVIDGGRSLPLGGAQQRAMLALLLTRPNEVVSTDRLIDELWGAQPPKTALNTIQYYVSQLRKALGADRIVTRQPGYLIDLEPGELDLERFEALVERDDVEALREGLALWCGPALADLAFEPFAQAETARLEELRLAALERRLQLDLEHGRDAELVGELEGLIVEHPLRERLRGQLMLALYRSGRQADALAAYQAARGTLVERVGIEPGSMLQELERAILRQDPLLLAEPVVHTATPEQHRSVIVAPSDADALDSLLAIAEPLARSAPSRELIVVRLVRSEDLAAASRLLHERADVLTAAGITARAAVFTSDDPGAELTRLASEQDADLVLLDATADFLAGGELRGVAGELLGSASCSVGVVVSRNKRAPAPDRPVLVPFAGAEHDWAAVELAAWIARASGSTLRLLGRDAELGSGERDASRLLASASLLVQRVVRVPTEPLLVTAGSEGILQAAADGGLLVFGLSDRWRQEGLGETRLAIAREAVCPTLLVRKGLKPGGIAPGQTMTRFTWSLASRGSETRKAGAGDRARSLPTRS
jgi:DNA-binding SARP family transcriptional activator